jgi:hypothetical protein
MAWYGSGGGHKNVRFYLTATSRTFYTNFEDRCTDQHKWIIEFDFPNSKGEGEVLCISSKPSQQNLNIPGTMKAQSSGISAQTSTNEAQTNYRIWFSKFKGGDAENFLGTPSTKFEYLGIDESTKVGNKYINKHKRMTEFDFRNSKLGEPRKWSFFSGKKQ